MAKRKTAQPWNRPAPKKAQHTKLTPARKAAAKRRAKRAGRHYPNLVDNMHEAQESSSKRKSAKRKSAPKRKPAAKKRPPARKKRAK
jgi:hypothetical protein